ncbi:NUDIX domain-containing protein [Luedemannella helvata]|uniref:NAD(+) diphosphatase n=1 Tax=Luedemannella helvata TaxID=349315 RepID=A0ABN2K1E9_9ACTN
MTVSYIPAVRAPRPPEPDDLAVFVVGADVMTDAVADRPEKCPSSDGLPRLGTLPDGAEPVPLGSVDGRPVWLVDLTGAAGERPDPQAMTIRPWTYFTTHPDQAVTQLVARALQVAHFRRGRVFCGVCATRMVDVAGQPARTCPACGRFEWPAPITVALVAVWRAGADGRRELLLARHTYGHRDFWALVGGYLDPAENLEDTARREVAEEVGLDVDEITYVGSEGWGTRAPGVLLTVFTARCADPQAAPAVDGREISAARFFPLDELPGELPPAESIARRVIDSLR